MRQKCEKVVQDLPKRCSIRWSQILGFFQVASKLRPRKRSKRRPRGAQDAPRASRERSKSGQERPQTTQERPKSCQERPQSDRNLPGGRPICQQGHVFVFFFVFFCFVAFFGGGVCCISLRLLYFFLQVCELMSRDTGFWGELPIVVSPLPAGWTPPSREPY